MTVLLSPVGGVAAQFFDNNGNPLSGGKLFSYSAGTTTPAATYTSSLGVTAHTNPIVLDSGGRVPGGEIWLTDGVIYKFVLQTSTNVLIATYDNIVGINSNFVNFTTEQEIQTATAGQTVFNLTTMQYQPGTNSLTVYVDGVNQYGPGAQYAYFETDSDTVTFVSGLHVGASVKFTTATQTTGNATDASVVAYTPPFVDSDTTNVEDKLAQYVSVKDFGAVGDGVTDDTVAIQNALDSGATVVGFTAGTYLVNTTLTLSTNGQKLLGQGGSLVKGTGAIEPLYLMTGTDVFDLGFENLKFTVKAGTTHAPQGGFIALTRCHFAQVTGCVFNAAIPGTVTERESIESCLNPLSCNYLQISNNQFLYSWGNGCSANDSVGDGVNGNNITISGNLFYNVFDTGVGIFTNAKNVTVSNNVFYRKDYSTAGNGVHIDVAGGQNVTIDGNVITGNTLGVRVLTNIGYTNQRIIISNNVIQEQDVGSTEPPQCVKISHDGAGGGQNDFNCMVLGNTFSVQDSGQGISISSTGTTDIVTAKIDSNMFNLRGASAVGVNFINTGAGNINLSPGKNTFIGQGSGAVAVQGTLPTLRNINGGQENLAFSKNDTTEAYGTGSNPAGSFYLGRGLYALTASIGAYTGVLTTLRIRNLAGVAKANTFELNTSSANTSFDSFWFDNNVQGTYQVTFDTGGSMSASLYYMNLVRLI